MFRDELIYDYDVSRGRTVVVSNPIDARKYTGTPRAIHKPPVVLVLGRISTRKGVDDVVALTHLLSELDIEVAIRIVGGHTLWSDYRPLLAGANKVNTTYIGPVPAENISTELAAADVLLQASKYEPFGLTVGEALAAGIPVIATSAVGAIQGTSRLSTEVVPIGDVHALASALRITLGRLRAEPITVRIAAQADAARLFEPRMIAKQISDFMGQVVSGCFAQEPSLDWYVAPDFGSSPNRATTIDVVVPSYRRPDLLEKCMSSLAWQSVDPNRIVVVVRRGDRATELVVKQWQEKRPDQVFDIQVDDAGVIAAMTAGVAATTGDIIAFTDDDAAPRTDWIERILSRFQDRSVGGVGGRDVVAGQEGPLTRDVGRISWYGRVVGNHHLGCGEPHSVDALKGVNMAFRAEALALPRAGILKGSGAQVHFEMLVSGHARLGGWRLVYDPNILVDHEIGHRVGTDHRWRPQAGAIFDGAFNASFSSAVLLGSDFRLRSLYGLLIGSRGEPGFGRLVAALARIEVEVIRRAPSAILGHIFGVAHGARRMELRDLMITAGDIRGGAIENPSTPMPIPIVD
jgi:hypothetical protein